MSVEQNILGYAAGDSCNRDGCDGVIHEHDKDGECSCHINPPCSYCTEPNAYCPKCGWDAKTEQDEYDKLQSEINKKNQSSFDKQNEEFQKRRYDFYKKYHGKLPVDKLEIRSEAHTHFTMKVFGVFPEGTENRESLLPKIRGTFGGRFDRFTNSSFEYTAYTD